MNELSRRVVFVYTGPGFSDFVELPKEYRLNMETRPPDIL